MVSNNYELSLNYRADIQGLRAIAIMLVVLAHAKVPGFSGGFVGVDVFFVLSGYLITGLLVSEYESKGSIQLAVFYARRLKRLLPALLVMLVIVVLMAFLLLSKQETVELISSVIYAATWTSNINFSLFTVDYFSELKARDLFLHTWSLGLEEQFYLVWPILILFMYKKINFPFDKNDKRRQLAWMLGGLFVSSFILSLYWLKYNPLWAFYMMPSRIWQFALGASVFVWCYKFDNKFAGNVSYGFWKTRIFAISVLGLVLIFGSAFLLHPRLAYPGTWAMLPSIGTALVIAGGQKNIHNGTGLFIVSSRFDLDW
jgi:peptidoglycan/LPS O-acetylase OafA/YrhL